MLSLLYGEDELIRQFVKSQLLDIEDFGHSHAIGIVRNQEIIAGVVYNHYYGRDIQASIASIDKKWANKTILRAIFDYPYRQLGCVRITAQTRASNCNAQIFLRKLGFRQEGLLRKWYNNDDAIIFGQLCSECPWYQSQRKLRENG